MINGLAFKSFVSILASLFSHAMRLKPQPLSDEQYYWEAKEIQKKIMEVNKSPTQHLAIRAIQEVSFSQTKGLSAYF